LLTHGAWMDLKSHHLHIMMASCIVNSVYAFISREIAIVVGLHVDEMEESGISGQVLHPAKFPTIYVT